MRKKKKKKKKKKGIRSHTGFERDHERGLWAYNRLLSYSVAMQLTTVTSVESYIFIRSPCLT